MLLDKKVEKGKKYLLKMSAFPIKTIRYESGAAYKCRNCSDGVDDKFAVGIMVK